MAVRGPFALHFPTDMDSLFRFFSLTILCTLLLTACGDSAWNNPYPASQQGKNILYSVFTERPKHLDPAKSYSSNEVIFIGQIYEPPLQYHYLKRPYELEPLVATSMPKPVYLDRNRHPLPDNASSDSIAFTRYDIGIKHGVYYQPHPAFARDKEGRSIYDHLTDSDLSNFHGIGNFHQTGTQELTSADYVYEIKRLAEPSLNSPIFGLMSDYILGLKEYSATLQKAASALKKQGEEHPWLDLDQYPLEGAQVIDRYTYRITLKGKYPQFIYWLAMPFFGPVPREADRFYSQPGMKERNLTLDWYPVGTGPFMLSVNDPNRQMILDRNPNFHGELYPSEGEPGDLKAGLLADAGKPIPFIDKAIYSLEKETIPYWNKFLQGYYDASGVSSDSFDQAISMSSQGEARLTPEMVKKGIRLATSVATSDWYMGFNMLDPVVGGYTEKARKLREAISIAVDYEEFVSIFNNGRGIGAQGPIPPGIFGYETGKDGINPYVYDWVNGAPKRKSIEYAKRLLAEAGYPNGRESLTGKPLLLYFDTMAGGVDDKSRLDWMVKQFQKLNIQLVIRSTDYNRFQDKMLKGNAQIFEWGWNADYPDPENFLFLLYGPNKKVGSNGENAANYDNPEFNHLFVKMKDMDNGPGRQAVIDQMVEIVRHDAPWAFGFHQKNYGLYHSWYLNAKPNLMANNSLKYLRIDPDLREQKREEWNKPVLWPLALALLILLAVLLPAWIAYRQRERRTAR